MQQHSLPETPQSAPPATPHTETASPQVTVANLDDDLSANTSRPPLKSTVSDPPALEGLSSPLRQHRRTPSAHRQVVETLDARVEYTNDESDGRTQHKVNQYTIVEEIGRGSYGAVHIATDQYGNEYAVKEFSKSRLRKRAQSQILRQGPRGPKRTVDRVKADGRPLTPQVGGERPGEKKDSLYLIREEVAIMKKLHHPNLVQLIEVLDDPEEDSLYMVLEMCKKGVIMKVGLEEDADPYSDESCRLWFRDLILGIEYLHAQGVIHRDIKPDNLLVSEDNVLKIVDFGVSEMFEGTDSMRIAKSAGSPAFLPPELCGTHADVSGEAVDIWSMGICLYCLRYGRIPFNKPTVLDMYEAVKSETPELPEDEDPVFKDLLLKILQKNPDDRIQMPELRNHPWVTKNGADPLLATEENCSHVVELPDEEELSHAFTRKMDNLFCVVKAINKFKSLVPSRLSASTTPETAEKQSGDYFKGEKKEKDGKEDNEGKESEDSFDPAEEKERAIEIEALLAQRKEAQTLRSSVSRRDTPKDTKENGDDKDEDEDDEPGKGHAKDISDQEPLLLRIGTHHKDHDAQDESTPHIVADSPTAVDFNIYDEAYEKAIKERLEANPSERPVMYLTKLVKETDYFKKLGSLVEGTAFSPDAIREQVRDTREQLYSRFTSPSTSKLAHLVGKIGLSDSPAETPAATDAKNTDSSNAAKDSKDDNISEGAKDAAKHTEATTSNEKVPPGAELYGKFMQFRSSLMRDGSDAPAVASGKEQEETLASKAEEAASAEASKQ